MICVSVFYDSIRYVAIDDVSYRESVFYEKHKVWAQMHHRNSIRY
jgi:hypothetical protein